MAMAASRLLFPLCTLLAVAAAATDTLKQGESLTTPATLVSSPSGVFELGFHAPDPNRPARLYLCIWYRSTQPRRTVAWVANRVSAATAASPSLTLTAAGELRVLDGAASDGAPMLWSSNTTTRVAPRGGYSAVLLDSGSFQVRDLDGTEIWYSFWHPSDTMLSGMRISVNAEVRAQVRGPPKRMLFTSWASDMDPSPGRFALGLDPVNPSQAFIWKDGNVPFWRPASSCPVRDFWSTGAAAARSDLNQSRAGAKQSQTKGDELLQRLADQAAQRRRQGGGKRSEN